MTDRDEFEKWFNENNLNTTNHTKELMQKVWQARGELDAVRIKELEADAKRWNFFIKICSQEVKFYITGITGNVTNEQINDSIDAHILNLNR